MKDKCIIIKESEYNSLLEMKVKYDNLKSKNESLQKDYDALKVSYDELDLGKISVDFTSYIREYTPSWQNVGALKKAKIIDTIDCSIHGNKITIQGKLRWILHNLKDNLREEINSYILNCLNTFSSREEAFVNENKDLMNENRRLIHKIERHNKSSWYKRFRKIK